MLRTAQSKNLPNLLNFFSLLQSENLWDDLHDIKKSYQPISNNWQSKIM